MKTLIGVAMMASVMTNVAWSESVREPATGAEFAARLSTGSGTLMITGADYRTALGEKAYALAHYAPETTWTALEARNVADRLDALIEYDGDKGIILKGVYPKVPARGIRWSWKASFRRVGFDGENRKAFIKLFDAPFKRGQELRFVNSQDGRLEISLDGRVLAEWDDPELAEAIWKVCLGPDAELVDRANLAQPERLKVRSRS